MSRPVFGALRVLLVLLFAGSLAAQIAAPAVSGLVLESGATIATLAALLIAAIVAVEVVLVSVWMLLGMVRDQRIFDEDGPSEGWVNAAIGALVAAAAIATATLVFAVVPPVSESPAGVTIAVLAAAVAGASAALALLVVVMRQLLHTAIRLSSELAEVI